MAAKQQTLKAPISFSGTGLHTGRQSDDDGTSRPGEQRHRFPPHRPGRQTRNSGPVRLCHGYLAGYDHRKGWRTRCDHRHIMSALWTLGVDNATIDVDAGETPIMDGSAKEYAKTIVETGLQPRSERTYYHVTEKWSIRFRKKAWPSSFTPTTILRIAARGLQLQGDRQPVRDLQSRRRLRLENRALPHLRLPA